MNDLISKSALIDALKIHFDSCFREDGELLYSDHICTSDDVVDLIKLVENQPIAYNVDKIVEELELHSFELGTDTLPVHYVRLNDAIEIVKQGGVSDDTDNMCEWKKLPFSWFAGCDGCKVEYKQGDYCPRCGKKIKIKAVEQMDEEYYCYCHYHNDTYEYFDCLDYMECEECPYYYADED